MSTVPRQTPGQSKQDYCTPPAFLRAVKRRLGIQNFLCDFAADESNTVAPLFYDIEHDALAQPAWEQYTEGGWGWLNPPFADIEPWAAKCKETYIAGGSIALLVPLSSANWCRDFVYLHAYILALNGRLAFIPEQPRWLYPKDCMLCLFAPLIMPGFEVWNWRERL